MSFERITIVGHVGKTFVKKSRQQVPYVRIGVAVNRGTKENRTTVWYSVLLFGRLAENPERLTQLYTSGRLVLVEGRPQVDLFDREDGTKEIDNTIIATSLPELLDKRPEGSPITA
jgi:single-stranded DNA-binding protein